MCIIHGGIDQGSNRERSLEKFYQLAATGLSGMEEIAQSQPLATWLALEVVTTLLESGNAVPKQPVKLGEPITAEEADIAAYVGGAVICKLKYKTKSSSEKLLLQAFIDTTSPESDTLTAAISRGKLINLTAQGKSLFKEMEQVFRDVVPASPSSVPKAIFINACCENQVIQDCFHTSAEFSESREARQNVLSCIISLFFKIRIHHRCRIFMENVRGKTKTSTKERALRAKLAK
jgi:hypothetical protein